ncbi:MAG TPA: peptide ABC transporter substrate-binding protein [Candidatus Acidoferrales bacterium]|nr:peptide ABC transporter substrate-binding protein [Candidatus Acidoferrales bacterium]
MKRALAALVAACVLAACTRVGSSTPDGARHPWTIPGHLRIGSTDEPDNLNPMFAHTDATDQIDALIFAPVFRYDEHGEFVPELATAVPTYENGGVSRDGKTITLHFRKDVTWSDGVALDARDFRFTWRAVMNPRNNVKLRAGWDDVDAIDLPDRYTAVVRLRQPNVSFVGALGGGGGSAYPPLPEHLLGKLPDINTAAFNAAPISSGPWLLKKWNHGASLEFAPNPRYWRGAPGLAAVSYRIIPNPDVLFTQLRTHEIDLIDSVTVNHIDELPHLDGIAVGKRLSANWRHLAFNTRRPALSDVRVRLAIAEAVDWDRINTVIYHGYNIRAHSDIMPTSWAAPDVPLYRHDPADARNLLDAAGWHAGGDGIRRKGGLALRTSISSSTNNQPNEQAEVQMQQQLRAVGIDLEIKNYPVSLLFAQDGPLYSGRYDMSWSVDTNGPDPDNAGSWAAQFIPPRGANTTFLSDAIVSQTALAATRSYDRQIRKALYQREEERIHELVPAVFLYWQNQFAAYNSDLKDYKPAQFITSFWNSWEWSM